MMESNSEIKTQELLHRKEEEELEGLPSRIEDPIIQTQSKADDFQVSQEQDNLIQDGIVLLCTKLTELLQTIMQLDVPLPKEWHAQNK